MINVFIGLLLVFCKTNLSFIDIGATYYITNMIGYIAIYFGIKELRTENKQFIKAKPYTAFMIFHSLLFFLLNITGNFPITMVLSTTLGMFISYLGLVFIIVGMFMIFYIIYLIIEGFKNELSSAFTLRKLDYIANIMVLAFLLAAISFIFNFIPMLAETLMAVLLLLKILFLIFYYNELLKKNEKRT